MPPGASINTGGVCYTAAAADSVYLFKAEKLAGVFLYRQIVTLCECVF